MGCLFFATKGILIKLAYPHEVGALTLIVWRLAYAAPFFIFLAWYCGRKADSPMGFRRIAMAMGLGVLGYHLCSYLDFLALERIGVGLARMIFFVYPTLTVIIGVLFLRERVGRAIPLLLGVTYLGIALCYIGDLGSGPNLLAGALLILSCALGWAVYLALSARATKAIGSARFTAWAMLGATATTWIHHLMVFPVENLGQPLVVHGYAVALAIIATIIPLLLVNEALRLLGSQRFVIIGTVGPVATLVYAGVILGEVIAPLQMLGMSIALMAVTVMALVRHRAQTPVQLPAQLPPVVGKTAATK